MLRTRPCSFVLSLLLTCASFATLLGLTPTAGATAQVVHTYEEIGDETHVGNFYPGFTYTGDDIVFCAYNYQAYPTGTPTCVVLPQSSGVIDIFSEDAMRGFEVDVATGGYGPVTIEGFDSVGVLVASTTCSSARGTYVRCGIGGALGIEMTRFRVSGASGFYVFDTATFTPTTSAGSNVKLHDNGDGTCTAYDDRNANGAVDAGEEIGTLPCSATDVPLNVPPQSFSQTLPPVSTPDVPPTPVTTPPVGIPATCTLPVCTSPTAIPAQSTPPIPQVCVPLVICVGPVEPQPLTPPVTVPALCAAAGPICLPPTTLVPSQTVTIPGQPPITLTPAVTVSVSSTGFAGLVEPNAGELTSIGPITTMVGPIPVTLCPSTCPMPVPPGASLAGSITVTVTVGTTTFTQTVPVTV